jgi:hypothetical protein
VAGAGACDQAGDAAAISAPVAMDKNRFIRSSLSGAISNSCRIGCAGRWRHGDAKISRTRRAADYSPRAASAAEKNRQLARRSRNQQGSRCIINATGRISPPPRARSVRQKRSRFIGCAFSCAPIASWTIAWLRRSLPCAGHVQEMKRSALDSGREGAGSEGWAAESFRRALLASLWRRRCEKPLCRYRRSRG